MRSVPQVLAAARAQVSKPSRDWTGWCLAFTRTAWGIKPTGIPDANAAWARAKRKRTSGTAPAGAPIYWAVGRFGHIAISAGDGKCYSTDIRRKGKVDLVPVSEVTSRWNAKHRGWSEDYAGTPLPLGTSTPRPPAPKPKPKPKPAPEPAPKPPAPKPRTRRQYRVRPGDTMGKIAAKHGVTLSALVKANDLADPDVIKVGQLLYLP